MDIRGSLKRQYHASLKTLRIAIDKCPDTMWNNPADGGAAFCRVAYHTLFFAHFYLQQGHEGYIPWPKHQDGAQDLRNPTCTPLTRQDTLEFWDYCNAAVDPAVDKLDLDAPQCGFPWYKMPTLDHQIVNIRHIQHHAAALSSRLRREAKIEVEWVGRA